MEEVILSSVLMLKDNRTTKIFAIFTNDTQTKNHWNSDVFSKNIQILNYILKQDLF
jgi:hypothetical protein